MLGSRQGRSRTALGHPLPQIGVLQLAKVYYHCLKACLNRQVPHQGLKFDLDFAFLKVEDIKDGLLSSVDKIIDGQMLTDWLYFFALGTRDRNEAEEKRLLSTFKLLLELIQSRTIPNFIFSSQSQLKIVEEDHDQNQSVDFFGTKQWQDVLLRIIN